VGQIGGVALTAACRTPRRLSGSREHSCHHHGGKRRLPSVDRVSISPGRAPEIVFIENNLPPTGRQGSDVERKRTKGHRGPHTAFRSGLRDRSRSGVNRVGRLTGEADPAAARGPGRPLWFPGPRHRLMVAGPVSGLFGSRHDWVAISGDNAADGRTEAIGANRP
jgi:hypothetical protein